MCSYMAGFIKGSQNVLRYNATRFGFTANRADSSFFPGLICTMCWLVDKPFSYLDISWYIFYLFRLFFTLADQVNGASVKKIKRVCVSVQLRV